MTNDFSIPLPGLWALVGPALVGGVLGGFFGLIFQESLFPWLRRKHEIKRALENFQVPLARSAETLERTINGHVQNIAQEWFTSSQYYRLSLLYTFGDFLARLHLADARVGEVGMEFSRSGRTLAQEMNGIHRALTSHAYFKKMDSSMVAGSAIPRRILDAVGEVMILNGAPLKFAEFCVRYERDEQFRRWFSQLEGFLDRAKPSADRLSWARLIACGMHLRLLVRTIDPKMRFSRVKYVANFSRVDFPEVRAELKKKFLPLMNARDQKL